MSRRLALILISLVFGSGILMISVVRAVEPDKLVAVEVEGVKVSEVGDEVMDSAGSPQADSAESQEVSLGEPEEGDYYLAYPGILPDHPLYFLKMLRDRVRLWLTRNAVKRIELKLLYADKRVGAAQALAEGNKVDLAVTTATKAENYMFEVIDELNKLREQGQELPEVWEKVERATGKHIEVLAGIVEKVPDQAKSSVEKAMEVSRLGQDKATEVLGRNRVEQEERVREGEEVGEGEGERVRQEEEMRVREEGGEGMNQNQEQKGREGE